jgi:hypothetical protein
MGNDSPDDTPGYTGGAKLISVIAQGTSGVASTLVYDESLRLASTFYEVLVTRFLSGLLLLIFLGMGFPVYVCHASSSTGSILGNIVDQDGAALARGTVELRNRETGVIRQAIVDRVGDYNFVLLPPGHYDLIARMSGFRDGVFSDIQVDVDQVVRADLKLEIAPVTSGVLVTGEIPLVESDTSSIGQVVPRGLIANLPLNERNYLNFTLLVPGAHTPVAGSQASTEGPGSVSVNGAREQANSFQVDGIDNTSPYINRTTVLPSVDAIEEFKVQSSSYSAEYGKNAGAQIDLVLKSGTNGFHGNAFEYFRNRELDAKNYFDLPYCTAASVPGSCGPIPRYQRNQFGGTFGGPIQKDRTFFFLSYEGLGLRQATTREATVPSQVMRDGLLAAIPAALQNAAGLATLNLYPAANVGTDLLTSTLFVSAPVIKDTVNEGTIKLDRQWTSRDLVSGHYSIYDVDSYLPFDTGFTVSNLPGFGDFHISRGQNMGVEWTHSFTPRTLNDVRFGFDRDDLKLFQQNIGIDRSAKLGYPSPPNPVDWGYPEAQITGYDTLGEPFSAPEDVVDNTFHLTDGVSWSPDLDQSRHHFKFGGDFHRVQQNGYADFYSRGLWLFIGVTGNSLEDLILGLPAVSLFGSGDTYTHLRNFSESFYALDDYHVLPNLTLNLGLRYEYNSVPVDINNRLSVADLSPSSADCTPQPSCQYVIAGSSGVPRGIYSDGKKNFAPRIGFAWTPLPNGRLVVRSAYGIFYDAMVFNINVLLGENPPFYQLLFSQNDGTNNIQSIIQSPLSSIISFRTAPNYKNAYLQQWSFGLESQLTSDLVLGATYVGSEGTHLIGFSDENQSQPGGAHPYPQFGSFAAMDTYRVSSYHSLQGRLQRRLQHGTSFLASYTWSKSIDNGSEFTTSNTEGQYAQSTYNLAGERGLSAFDARERLVLSLVSQLPFGPHEQFLDRDDWLGKLVSNWQISGLVSLQTGQPFTVNRSAYQSYTTLIAGTDRPDLMANPFQPGPVPSNPDPACHSTISQGGLAADHVRTIASWINPCAYSNPNLLGEIRFGTSPRNEVTGPGLADLDTSISRSFPFAHERFSLNSRVDVFNILNHPNFDPPVRTYDSQNFGSLPSANAFGNRPPRQIQVALVLRF